MLTIKQILEYQVRKDRVIFFLLLF